jgi:RHS repeat-associated protein
MTYMMASKYDAFGTPYQGDFSSGMNLGYTGKPYDPATGLYNYGYRDYQPAVARFTTVDPVRDGNNWFAYVNNDPVNYFDPDGEAINFVAAGVGAALGGAIGAGVAIITGKSGREIVAAAVGGVVTGGMAGLTMGGSLVVQMAAGALAQTAGYMAENIVNGNPHTVAGTAQSIVEGVTGKMADDILGKVGEVTKVLVNEPHMTYMQSVNVQSVAPLQVDFKDTIKTMDANTRAVDIATATVGLTAGVARDVYNNKSGKSK